jgi:CubicO group peptidase (beta-lactamase class C family)
VGAWQTLMFPLFLALLLPASIDDVVRTSLEKNHVPGAVIAVARPGRPVSVTAYGLANVEARTAVDPEVTAFRTASVSKVITASVVAQLIEQGKLDPAADVNRYLDFRIPAFDGKAVTLSHLLTHTAGFDDRYTGKSARNFKDALPLGVYLKQNLPARIVPPGEVFLYSNYGIALAGYISERVADKPFAELVRDMVFQPLGMAHSSFLLAQPAATPYLWSGSTYQALPWDYLQDAPAGMQMSSGADMGRFLRWALDHASRPEFQPHFSQHPRLQGGIGWVWESGRSRGHHFLGHDGGYPGAVARLRLFPSDGAGYFIAGNALSGAFLAEVSSHIEEDFVAEATPPSPAKPSNWDTNVAAFEGTYRDIRYSHDRLIKVGVLLGFLGGELKIGVTPQGLITMPKLDGTPRRLAQIEPNLFQSLDDDYFCSFRRDASGRVTHLFTSGVSALERVPWPQSAPVQRNVFLLCALGLLFVIVGPARRWLLPESFRAPANWAANSFAFQLLGLGVVLQLMTTPAERASSYMYGFPWPIWIVQTLGITGVACSAWFVARLIRLKPRTALPWLCAAMLTVYSAWLWHWRLLGYWF